MKMENDGEKLGGKEKRKEGRKGSGQGLRRGEGGKGGREGGKLVIGGKNDEEDGKNGKIIEKNNRLSQEKGLESRFLCTGHEKKMGNGFLCISLR